jgi:hypothetical protein
MKVATLKSLVFLFFFAFLTSCSDDNEPKQFSLDQPSAIDAEDYAVYTAVISSFNSSNVVIAQKTAFGMSFMEPDNSYVITSLSEGNPGFEPEMVTTLIDNNINPLFLDYSFPISSTHVILVPQAELNYIFNTDSDNDWMQFYNTFPNANGFNQFSAVAYNADKTKALLETGNVCGSLCGLGTLFYLEKENSVWIIKKTVDTWIS